VSHALVHGRNKLTCCQFTRGPSGTQISELEVNRATECNRRNEILLNGGNDHRSTSAF
jgi:hypothetical protein